MHKYEERERESKNNVSIKFLDVNEATRYDD